mmetsp:Transcript_29187/g.67675  ORF Transcript_29187/g.67675 Transcript_29187/m.67675 type:complete len:116 (-) Transcript_29187:83-430(-)
MGRLWRTLQCSRIWYPFHVVFALATELVTKHDSDFSTGLIDTRLTQTKSDQAMEVDGTKVQLGLPEGFREMAASMIPLGRPGDATEAAGSILMLASPHASYISGQIIEVTGGANL